MTAARHESSVGCGPAPAPRERHRAAGPTLQEPEQRLKFLRASTPARGVRYRCDGRRADSFRRARSEGSALIREPAAFHYELLFALYQKRVVQFASVSTQSILFRSARIVRARAYPHGQFPAGGVQARLLQRQQATPHIAQKRSRALPSPYSART